jgi:hypothetical protein
VVKRKEKITLSQHRDPYNIPVINNWYNLLPTSTKCKDSETTSLSVVQQKRAGVPNRGPTWPPAQLGGFSVTFQWRNGERDITEIPL